MKTSSRTSPSIITEAATFVGIDYHKRYSVWHAIDAAGSDLGKGRIEHHSPHDFATLVKRWPNARVFEASMNWHWLYAKKMPGIYLRGLKAGGLKSSSLSKVKGSDPRKVLLADLLWRRTVVSQEWLAEN